MIFRTRNIAIVSLLAGPTAVAATDGLLGATSTGTVNVSVNLVAAPPPDIQISGLADLAFSQSVQIGQSERIYSTGEMACVYATSPLNYTLDVVAPDLSGAQSGAFMPFTININPIEDNLSTRTERLASGADLQSVTALTASEDVACRDRTQVRYYVTLDPSSEAFPATADVYAGTLTFTVRPE